MRISRRQWLAGAGLLAATYPTLIEPRWLEVSTTSIRLRRPLAHPVRILHLADLHASLFVPLDMIRRAIELGLREKHDLVCLTGDFITNSSGFHPDEYVDVLRYLVRSSGAPVFAVLGNHDGGFWSTRHRGHSSHQLVESILERSGIHLLHNRSAHVTCGSVELTVAGVGDLWSGEVTEDAAFSDTHSSRPVVLMAHNPDTKSILRSDLWDLMISGHTHGGQVLIPFEGPRFAPVEDKRYVAGLKPWRDSQIYVTRGVGNLGSVRFRCRPEVSLLEMS